MADNTTYYLVKAYLEDRISAAEKEELEKLVAGKASEEELIEALKKYLASVQPDSSVDKKALEYIWKHAVAVDKGVQPAKIRSIKPWIKWVAAASIIVVLGIGALLWINRKAKDAAQTTVAKTNDVPAPTNTRAVITLADGSKVYLDSVNNGTIATDNDVNVVKSEQGEIVYQKLTANSQQLTASYNTLFNPRGSKVISLTLSDGTRVWLNSESSLKYPTAFTANTREVEITGEAYFEVKHNSKQPFKVHLPNGSIVEDLGTEFNINAYADEGDIKTTLIEGSVRISNGSPDHQITRSQILTPGQQSVINRSSPDHQITRSADINEVTAWRNNKFYFESADIHSIARQLSRWYDVDVEIKDNINEHFTGIIDREVKVSQVFQMLQKTGAVKFSVEGKKIVITK